VKKSRKPINQGIGQLTQLLKRGDLDAAQTSAADIYQRLTIIPAPSASLFSGVTVDPVLVARTNQFLRHKAACKIAKTFYNHAELDLAKQWAETCDFTVNDQYTRRARVLLADIATAMDKDDDAIALYTGIINEKNQRREQPAAYAGLLELLQLSHQDDQIEPWVRHGQHKFRKAGGLQQRFLWAASRVLRRRNHPLWHEINAQIVEKTADGAKWKLKAQRELASNARKFGRYDEAETHYAAICAQPMKSTVDTVNMHLFLAESQAKQNKDYAATLQELSNKAATFRRQDQKDYAAYRTAKFYQSHGREDVAASQFSALAFGFTNTTWCAAALNQSAKLAEKSGDSRRALQLYLQYPQRFPDDQRLAMQAYAGALNVAVSLGDVEAIEQVSRAIKINSENISDYNTLLNLALFYKNRGQEVRAREFLEKSLLLAQRQLTATRDQNQKVKIHFHVTRRHVDFHQWQEAVTHLETHRNDLVESLSVKKEFLYGCYYYKALALQALRRHQEAKELCEEIVQKVSEDPKLGGDFVNLLGNATWFVGGFREAKPIFEWLDEKWPSHSMTNAARVQLATESFKQRKYDEALALADKAIAACSENSKMVGIQRIFWEATYLRGRCLIALGSSNEGVPLVERAMNSGKATIMKFRLAKSAA
jgi:tetratricopeptide (TPR) repeat protein